MKFDPDALRVSRTVIACMGMGAMLGLLLGGTVFGLPVAIATTVVGGLGGGVLGRYVE